jgi:murein DD-endopeptidase MepM/ murein hydrolase activator NlpD
VHATHSGTVDVNANTWPGGNCIFVNDGEYRTTYCHLQGFSVTDGESVQQGEVIGEVGSTGNSSGPHLHYEVWKGGVNQNPLDYGALEATDK